MFAIRLLPFTRVDAQSSIMGVYYQILMEMKRFSTFSLWLSCLMPSLAASDEITVFAASSLRDALGTIAAEYQVKADTEVVLVFAASSAIARQVAQGAPADVVLLANEDWGRWLVDQATVDAVVPFAGNHLVLIGRGDAPTLDNDVLGLMGDGPIAMAQVDAVPAGRYGRAALVSLGVWDVVEPRVVQAANVRAALRFVQRGEVDTGIGYASDLVSLPDLTELYRFAPDSHPQIVYVGASITTDGDGFMAYLQSVAAQNILKDWGFKPLTEAP
jgi:molybdate transport system substrate-binding protein